LWNSEGNLEKMKYKNSQTVCTVFKKIDYIRALKSVYWMDKWTGLKKEKQHNAFKCQYEKITNLITQS
jgi:hypothetical protein